MIKDENRTIAAISTAVSPSGIGIVRMSGNQSIEIADKVFKGKKSLHESKSHRIHYGHIYEENQMVDEVLVMLMKGPHSFTKEDTVEINCHGGVFIVKKVLDLLIKNGASPALPGEFTKRAFLNGRMDLSQAEAVSDLIYSQNDYALKNSVNQLKGKLKDTIQEIRNEIIYNTAFIETALDDPEHISMEGFSDKLNIEIKKWLKKLNNLIDSNENGKIISEGIKTVIVGKPNAGKSSLLNVLLGEERAIVTDIEGTTRDILEEHINLNGILLNIIDTAGIRDTDDKVEKIGVSKAASYVEEADLILYVIDASRALDENDETIMKMIDGKKCIFLLNKTDLDTVISKSDFASNLANSNLKENAVIEVSAINITGIDEVEETIKRMFYEGNISFNNEIFITNVRQKDALVHAKESILRVESSVENQMPEDLYTIDLLDAYEYLGEITGETIGEDLVNEIFQKFCMGK
ncbi:tRNA modification GTPase [Aequitasia blattaphilus]|uniref:tRNA modification GTPase MnmE n=1 Tax=Aequitasia blattaphilus TaxID=2949332 RepID=A0ABT1EBA0_9FIRM|nr:tRNA uridine-5-carboxymethylaminomethyl(34) synthesis GTPase MnmE [Aequitasia blattaphilus]MCP1103111.1 tRNA uridine-5-carboxymethylaminomethyl(34) synthesis GTPase MnmE [Aequitasia blattaphilus]MCR8615751.1 tRNA uridine-5-carboxymethylaminomethyl(34) synthesis GTPase MnmE [Aequitasia blattaphilus]